MNSLSWWLSGAWEQSADWWDCERTRGCQQGQPLLHYSGRQSFTPSWITSGLLFFVFLRELTKSSWHMGQSQQALLFPVNASLPSGGKSNPIANGMSCAKGAPSAPCTPGADVVQDWLLCPFPCRELGFLFSCGNEPRSLALCRSRLLLNGFYSLRRTPQLWPVDGYLY